MSKKVQEVQGDLLSHPAEYLCHQCNCVTTNASGLAKAVFKKFPCADIYSDRVEPDEPGKIIVCGDGKTERYIVNLLAQYYPGKAKYANDSPEKRLKWFSDCLSKLESLDGKSYAFPNRIGCGLAGGDWEKYRQKLNEFAGRVKGDVFIVKVS